VARGAGSAARACVGLRARARRLTRHARRATLEVITVSIFTSEFLLRLLSCPNLLKFLRTPLNVVDLCAILPWYIELALSSKSVRWAVPWRCRACVYLGVCAHGRATCAAPPCSVSCAS
jgi:hypothetical protein